MGSKPSIWISGAILILGGALSLFAALLAYDRAAALAKSRLEGVVSAHADLIKEHLAARETTARVIATVFRPPAELGPRALGEIDARLLQLLPDINSLVWIPRVRPAEREAAIESLRDSGVGEPRLFGAGRAPLEPARLDQPFYPVLDIAPKTPANLTSLGLVISALPHPGAALRRAEETGQVVATPPIELVQAPGVPALVAYVPVYGRAPRGDPGAVGFLGFSFRIDGLINAAIDGAPLPGFSMRVRDLDAPASGDFLSLGGARADSAGAMTIERRVEFAGRQWAVTYVPEADALRQADGEFRFYAATGGVLTLALAGSFFSVARSRERLQQEMARREETRRALEASEKRLGAVLQGAPVGIILADAPSGRLVYGNDRVAEIWRRPFKPAPDLNGYSAYVGLHADGRPYRPTEWPLARAIVGGEVIEGEEIEIVRGDETHGHIIANAAPIFDEANRIVAGVVAFADISERKQREAERAEHQRHLEFLIQELSHRIKNLFAVIQAMVRQTAKQSCSVEHFEQSFTGRIQALAHAHDLLVGQHWQGAPLRDVIVAQLRAFADEASSRVTVSGPNLRVSPAAAQSIGLAVFELATNAMKYGALSVPEGRVEVSWSFSPPGGDFQLEWRERGGPPVKPPARRGFGGVVLERMTSAWEGTRAKLDYAPGGLVWTLTVAGESVARSGFLAREERVSAS